MKREIQFYVAKKIKRWLSLLEQDLEQQSFSRFATEPQNLVIDKPYRLVNPQHMEIGDDVYLGPNSMLNCIVAYPSQVLNPPASVVPKTYSPKIVIGNKVSATGGLQVAACQEVVLEDEVLLATNVHMTDNFHGYEHVDLAYKFQHLWRAGPIRIGRGSWLGQNVVVAPGITVGEMSIIGANSVVTSDIPPHSIAVGAPARVMRRWCERESNWVVAD